MLCIPFWMSPCPSFVCCCWLRRITSHQYFSNYSAKQRGLNQSLSLGASSQFRELEWGPAFIILQGANTWDCLSKAWVRKGCGTTRRTLSHWAAGSCFCVIFSLLCSCIAGRSQWNSSHCPELSFSPPPHLLNAFLLMMEGWLGVSSSDLIWTRILQIYIHFNAEIK